MIDRMSREAEDKPEGTCLSSEFSSAIIGLYGVDGLRANSPLETLLLQGAWRFEFNHGRTKDPVAQRRAHSLSTPSETHILVPSRLPSSNNSQLGNSGIRALLGR